MIERDSGSFKSFRRRPITQFFRVSSATSDDMLNGCVATYVAFDKFHCYWFTGWHWHSFIINQASSVFSKILCSCLIGFEITAALYSVRDECNSLQKILTSIPSSGLFAYKSLEVCSLVDEAKPLCQHGRP